MIVQVYMALLEDDDSVTVMAEEKATVIGHFADGQSTADSVENLYALGVTRMDSMMSAVHGKINEAAQQIVDNVRRFPQDT